MPIRNYGVLKGRAVRGIPERQGRTPHFQVLVDSDGVQFRVAIGTRSAVGAPDLLYFADPDFQHSFLERLTGLEDGFHPLDPNRESGALDYIRGSLVRREQMQPLPVDLPGRDNDLSEKIGSLIDRAKADPAARLYAFGGRWGPEPQQRDVEFGFLPGNGLHDVHMNQGSPAAITRATTAPGRTARSWSTSPARTAGPRCSSPSRRRAGRRPMPPRWRDRSRTRPEGTARQRITEGDPRLELGHRNRWPSSRRSPLDGERDGSVLAGPATKSGTGRNDAMHCQHEADPWCRLASAGCMGPVRWHRI